MPSPIRKTFQYGNHQITLETGLVARQSTAAVMVTMGETVILVTVVANPTLKEGIDFFPLTVNYFEKTYAAGKIPGSFLKREGKPSDREVLIARLIDRPLRPLFADNFYYEVQITATVLSFDPEVSPDIPAIIGASAALSISGLPFSGPISAARVGYHQQQFTLNPPTKDLTSSDLDLVVAGTEHGVLMVESSANELPEDIMLAAVIYGHQQGQTAITAIKEFAQDVGTATWEWTAPENHPELYAQIKALVGEKLKSAYQIHEKTTRKNAIKSCQEEVLQHFKDTQPTLDANSLNKTLSKLESDIMREDILNTHRRIDGRDLTTVRPISIETSYLPRTHGSALFTRGETQAIVVATLGTERDGQILDNIEGDTKDTFMLHYNFPPFAVGETGPMTGPKRREIGHGRLAKRAIAAVLPSLNDFPYIIRIVSEITESNGSSSMASVCGSSLALMDAGVPIKAPVAGIAMGLIKEGDRFAILSDILGDEDHLGDMDFKVAGTTKGVTALQMDLKIDAITPAIMAQALAQAGQGRLHILNEMNKALNQTRANLSKYAPQIISLKINPEKIRDVIGKGGAVIKALTEETKTQIDISENGLVKIFATDLALGEEAKKRIESLTAEVEIGKIYEGTVVKIADFGAFVNILPGKDGLVHISQISQERINQVSDFLQEGQKVKVKAVELDRQGRLKLSIKDAE